MIVMRASSHGSDVPAGSERGRARRRGSRSVLASVELNREGHHAVHGSHEVVVEDEALLERRVREPLKQLLEQDLQGQAGKGRTHAEVGTVAERHVTTS